MDDSDDLQRKTINTHPGQAARRLYSRTQDWELATMGERKVLSGWNANLHTTRGAIERC